MSLVPASDCHRCNTKASGSEPTFAVERHVGNLPANTGGRSPYSLSQSSRFDRFDCGVGRTSAIGYTGGQPMRSGNRSEDEIFEAALQHATREKRATYLNEACGDDARLRERVEALLKAHDQAGEFLEQAPAGVSAKTFVVTTGMVPVTEGPGDRIGRYKLRENLGEGGCGVVYVAEQEEPVRRRVALKVIKLGMDTKQVIARFDAERQALAMMDHPNIAQIFDAGITDTPLPASGHPLPSSDEGRGQGEGSQSSATRHSALGTHYGRPYFVMELVRGIKITDYCEDRKSVV